MRLQTRGPDTDETNIGKTDHMQQSLWLKKPITAISATLLAFVASGAALTQLASADQTTAVANKAKLDAAVATANTPLAAKASEPAFVLDQLSPLDVHPRTSLTIVEQLRHNHYLSKDLDDDISSAVFDKYMGMLDGARSYFTAADVAEFEAYRHSLDDALKRGNLKPAFQIFNRYQERLVERLEFLLASLRTPFTEDDFKADEFLQIDREAAPWPADVAELDDLWRKRLKGAALAMKLNGKELPEISELLTKRYKNRLKQTKQTKSEDAFQLYVNAFAATYDPHTQYYSPRTSQNFNINMSLQLEGIGAVLRSEDDYTSIVRLVPAGPADKTGQIKAADRIVSVGQGEGPLIDVVGWRLDDVVELIRGPKGSVVKLEVLADGDESGISKMVEITRNTVQLEEQAAQKKLITLNRGGRDYRIGVVEVPTFYVDFKGIQQGDPNYKSTTRDVRRLIEELKTEGIDGLVVDLRNNGGGSLQEADSLTGLFIKSGPTVQVKAARRRPNIYADTDDAITWEGPMAVVVNRLSASASEIFAGAIQDYERGIIIGSQTFGKGTVQTLIPLNRGQLKITAAKFYRVSGQSTQHQGILPDVEFPELYDTDRIGESSLDDALPWDVIQPAVYPHSDRIAPFVDQLSAKHQTRAANNPDFNYLRALAAKSRENNEREFISLNEAKRVAEKEQDDQWRLQLENTLRTAKGESLLASLDDLEKEAEAEEAKVAAEKLAQIEKDKAAEARGETVQGEEAEDELAEVEDDALLRESGNVLLDFISLRRQVAAAEQVQERTSIQ